MKVVLIDPPTSHEQIYGDWDLSSVDTYCPPLGLLYIAGFVRKNGHIPFVIDIPALKWSLGKTTDFILSKNPDAVGISAMTTNLLNANKIADQLKKNGLRAPIILGGAHVTAVPVETLKRFEAFDYGVLGEGEITFLELIERMEGKKLLAHVKGIVWRDKSGEIIVNSPHPLIKDLDILPIPAWDLLANFPDGYRHSALETKRLPSASIITSRGCPNQCTFCDRSVFGSAVRHHSAEYTLSMVRYLRETYRIKDLMILDDNFLLDKRKLYQICDTIIEEKMDLRWYCLSHVRYMTEERLKKIKEAGCWVMEVGIESGCQRILQLLKRKTEKQEIAEAVKRARDVGIRIKGNFIFGLPTETRESLEETIRFATSIDISLFQQTFLTVWPGSELSEDAGKYGKVETDWSKLSHFQISFIPNGLTREDLLRYSKVAFRRFYLRPRIIYEILISLTSLRAVYCTIIAFLVFLKTVFRKIEK